MFRRLEQTLVNGRGAAAQRMTSRVTVRRRTGGRIRTDQGAFDEWRTVATDVPCRLHRDWSARSDAERAGDVSTERASGTVSLPIGADLADGDLIEVDSGENVGMVIRLEHAPTEGRPGADQVTALRVRGVEAARPEEWSLWP